MNMAESDVYFDRPFDVPPPVPAFSSDGKICMKVNLRVRIVYKNSKESYFLVIHPKTRNTISVHEIKSQITHVVKRDINGDIHIHIQPNDVQLFEVVGDQQTELTCDIIHLTERCNPQWTTNGIEWFPTPPPQRTFVFFAPFDREK